MNRHFWHRSMALLCALLLITAALLTGCQSEAPKQWHDHETPSAMGVAYTDEADGTLTLTIKDCEGNLLFTKANITKKGLVQNLDEGLLSLSWVTSNNPGGFESVYIDRMHCRVSELIVGEQATDGTRLVYSQIKKGKLIVTVQDLFDKSAYCEETVLEDAYLGGDYTVLGTQMATEDQANVSYLVKADGSHRIVSFELYPDGKPTEKTTTTTEEAKKTEKTKKTEKADKTEKTKK